MKNKYVCSLSFCEQKRDTKFFNQQKNEQQKKGQQKKRYDEKEKK